MNCVSHPYVQFIFPKEEAGKYYRIFSKKTIIVIFCKNKAKGILGVSSVWHGIILLTKVVTPVSSSSRPGLFGKTLSTKACSHTHTHTQNLKHREMLEVCNQYYAFIVLLLFLKGFFLKKKCSLTVVMTTTTVSCHLPWRTTSHRC